MIGSLAAEGGLGSTLWAGPEKISSRMKSGEVPIQGTQRSEPVALKLGFASDSYGYAVDLGLPIPSRSRFQFDPEFKVETVWMGEQLTRNAMIADRRGPLVRVRRREDGTWRDALRSDPALGLGLNTHDGHVTYAGVAEAHGMASVSLDEALS